MQQIGWLVAEIEASLEVLDTPEETNEIEDKARRLNNAILVNMIHLQI
jgi:hypothetical protein